MCFYSPVNLTDDLHSKRIDDLKQEIPALEESLVMQCCPCSGPTPTISALFTDAPNSIDISEINTTDIVDLDQDYDETTTNEIQSEDFITTTEFDGSLFFDKNIYTYHYM